MRVFGSALLGATALICPLMAIDQPQLSQQQVDEIVQKFAAKETAFAQARENYTYKQSAKIQTLDESGNPTGKWEQVSDIIFSSEGKRTEHVTFAPVNTLRDIILTPEDMQDLISVQPFVLTTNELAKYWIRFLGKQQVDEIPCYVFAVKPKKLEGNTRYFAGEIWVDDRDLQIVKSYGRGVGTATKKSDNQFPKFETYREQVDGKYWFPTYTIANDTLHFKDNDQRIKQTVKYEDYKQFKSDVKITFGDAVDDKGEQKKSEPPKRP